MRRNALSNKKEKKGVAVEAGGPRTGAKANKEALADVFKRLDDCVMRDEFEKTDADCSRAVASVAVFRT